jgi:hypothetical protein
MNPGCTLIAFLKGKREKREELLSVLRGFVNPTRAEAGCVCNWSWCRPRTALPTKSAADARCGGRAAAPTHRGQSIARLHGGPRPPRVRTPLRERSSMP